MWAETTPNGKVKFKEQYIDPLSGKKKRVSVTMDKNTSRTRRQAEEILRAKMSAPDVDNLTLMQLIDLYHESQQHTVKQSTCIRNYGELKVIAGIIGENTKLRSLNARIINYRLQSSDLSATTTNDYITRLKALIRWAYNNDYIQDITWMDKIQRRKDDERAERLEYKYLESSDLKKLLDAMTVMKWKYLAQFTALSGLRIGEAIALDRKDVDLKERVIHVTKTFDHQTRTVTSPKTPASYRDVYIQDELLACCRDIFKYMADERQHTNIVSPLFMHDVNGGYLKYDSYEDYLGKVSSKVLGRKITSHYMRHTHVALLAEQDIPLDVISRRLGHNDSKVTREVYFHITDKLRKRDNEKLKEVRLI